MNRVTFFTKPECQLWDAALFVVEKVRQAHAFELERVDISAAGNEAWADRYGQHIPVVHLNGQEIFRHRVDERRFRALMRRAVGPA